MSAETTEYFDVGVQTVASPKHPWENHDKVFFLTNQRAGGLADGLGKSAAPEKAAQAAVDFQMEAMARLPSDHTTTPDELAVIMKGILLASNEHVIATGGRATPVLDKIWEGANGNRAGIVVGLGHPRAYLETGDQLQHLLLDDSIAEIGLDRAWGILFQQTISDAESMQKIPPKFQTVYRIYKEQGKIRYALGDPTQYIAPRIQTAIFELPPGGLIVTASDGSFKNIRERRIRAALNRPGSTSQSAANEIVTGALLSPDALHAQRDDITVKVAGFRPRRQ